MSVVARADVWEARRKATAYDAYARASRIDEDPKRDDEAEALYRRAIELDPSLVGALTNLGNLCYRRRRVGEATDLYERAVAIDERHAEAHYNLGYILLERRDPWRSIPHFRRALAANPGFADAHFNVAVAYEQIGERSAARRHWERYVEIEPKGAWAEAARGRLGCATGLAAKLATCAST
ncbi:MAG TPA: tetratricopeptide repeat protein [Polyangiaceae bacterium]|jgi:tetratricopeptide (TPR) repeat protein